MTESQTLLPGQFIPPNKKRSEAWDELRKLGKIDCGTWLTSESAAIIALDRYEKRTEHCTPSIRLDIEGMWFNKSDLIELRDFLSELIGEME